MLDAPVFGTRVALERDRALAVLRSAAAEKCRAPLHRAWRQRTWSRAVFPDQLACPENLVGDREIPDHPLVIRRLPDCLLEAMDFPGLKRVPRGDGCGGSCHLIARDTTEPSPMCHEAC